MLMHEGKGMFDKKITRASLSKVALGNFLWMIGLACCVQALSQSGERGNSIGFAGFDWWIHLQYSLSLNPREFSYFVAAVAFGASSLIHLYHLIRALSALDE
jgi:hypothetical protein